MPSDGVLIALIGASVPFSLALGRGGWQIYLDQRKRHDDVRAAALAVLAAKDQEIDELRSQVRTLELERERWQATTPARRSRSGSGTG